MYATEQTAEYFCRILKPSEIQGHYPPNPTIAHRHCVPGQRLKCDFGYTGREPLRRKTRQDYEALVMKLKHTFLVLLLSLLFIGGALAAGSPMNEDFSQLATLTQKAIETGKTGNAEAFAADAEAAFKLAKEKNATANSPAMQRIASKLKAAMNEAKAGKIPEGTAALEEALANMKQGTTAPKFGGGS
jgi:hypothetical protein